MTQYLFFIIDNEPYAIEAQIVDEIVDFTPITRVPKSNKAILGVVNIRGDIIAVVDPSIVFKQEPLQDTKRRSFVIVNIPSLKDSTKTIQVAFMVDLVNEVEYVNETDILQTPEFGTKIDKLFIKNVIHFNDDYINVLDIDTLLNIKELSKVL